MTNIKKVAIYLRLSNEDRCKDILSNSESIKNQRLLLLEEISKKEDYVLFDEYCDEDLSGAGTYRPEFERLIKDCEKGKIDIVLCKSQSRFSRDVEIIEKYLHNKFLEWNVRFIGLVDNTDTSDVANKKTRQINSLVNEWYLEDVSNNIRSAFKAKMRAGDFISPFAAFGYVVSKKDNNKLLIDPMAASIVREIYNMYIKGMGYSAIAKDLNNRNIPSPSLYKYQKGIKQNVISNQPRDRIKWSLNAVKTILTNELYIGNLIQGKRTTISYKNHKIKKKDKTEWIRKDNTHEAIIDKQTFFKVQNSIKKRTRQLKNTGMIHIFSGVVFCMECNGNMIKKNSCNHQYLVCKNKDCINKTGIRFDDLEKVILNSINEKVKKYYNDVFLKSLIMNDLLPKKEKLLNTEKLAIIKEITKIKNYLKKLYEDKWNKLVTQEQFYFLYKIYINDITTYKQKLNGINNQLKCLQNNLYNNTLLLRNKAFNCLNSVIINEFIKKIYIDKLNKDNQSRMITIYWNSSIQ